MEDDEKLLADYQKKLTELNACLEAEFEKAKEKDVLAERINAITSQLEDYAERDEKEASEKELTQKLKNNSLDLEKKKTEKEELVIKCNALKEERKSLEGAEGEKAKAEAERKEYEGKSLTVSQFLLN